MLGGLIFLGIVLNLILSHYVAVTAEQKEIGYGTTYFISLLFSPLIGLLFSIASPLKQK